MGRALEVISGRVTAPGTTITALTMNTGDSLTVRNTALDKRIWLMQTWVDSQGGGVLRIRSPQLHDNVEAIRFRHVASEVRPLMPIGFPERLLPQDVLVAALSGSATAGDIETAAFMIYYEDLPGISARIFRPTEIFPRIRHILTVEADLGAVTSSGNYAGEQTLVADFDLLKANTDYAILGCHTSAEGLLIGIRGPDTGNLRVAVPANDFAKQITGNWFVRMSNEYDVGLIPVFNSANRAGMLVDVVSDENAATYIFSFILAELG